MTKLEELLIKKAALERDLDEALSLMPPPKPVKTHTPPSFTHSLHRELKRLNMTKDQLLTLLKSVGHENSIH